MIVVTGGAGFIGMAQWGGAATVAFGDALRTVLAGDDLGLVHRGRLEPAVEEAAFALKPGEVSDLVETVYGFHLLKVEERVPETAKPFETMKDRLRKDLEATAREARTQEWVRALEKAAKIESVVAKPPAPKPGSPGAGKP